jgi:ATP-dependent helicase/nuclease subunit A
VTTAADASFYAFRTNVVVMASAGTGKTFRLVTLYALLALGLTSKGEANETNAAPAIAPSRIAATTFSRAAASEIRARVERLLRAVASGEFTPETEPYRAVLERRSHAVGGDPIGSKAMQRRARESLDDLPQALIDTLHGLSARIVRASALELGHSPSFAILDDDEARATAGAAIDETLAAALERSDPAARYLLDAAGGLANARERIADLFDRACEEGVTVGELAVTDAAADAARLTEELIVLARGLVAERSRGFAEAAQAFLRVASDFRPGRPTDAGALSVIEPLFTRRAPAKPLASEEAFVRFRESIKGESLAEKARRLAAFLALARELSPRGLGVRAILDEMSTRLRRSRQRAGALGFGDILLLARDALRDRPDIAARVRRSFDVLLVDEFQDTSRVQRDIVYLLRERDERARARRPGSVPSGSDLEPDGLMIVGDRKQSIYGFRGADVSVFTRVLGELAGEEARTMLGLGDDAPVAIHPNAALLTLRDNRRSVGAILDFVNAFAREDFGAHAAAFEISYADAEWLRPANRSDREPGGVTVIDDVDVEESPAPLSPAVPLPSILRGASPPLREACIAAALIDRAVRDRLLGPVWFGDPAVLARRRATLPLLEFTLSRFEIPFVVAGRGLFDTREVRDLARILRLVVDPFDRHALATVLRGPALALGDASLALLSQPGAGLLPESAWFGPGGAASRLSDPERTRLLRFAERFAVLRSVCLGLGPSDALRYAIEKLEIDVVAAALPRAAQRLSNMDRLVAIAAGRGGSLPSFVRWLDRQIDDEADETEAAVLSPGEDAVTLMTIHASKGLEFDAVVVVDLAAQVRALAPPIALAPATPGRPARLVLRHTRGDGGTLFTPEGADFARELSDREIAERKRLSYVAMTRAKKRLFLLAPAAAPNGSAMVALRRLLREPTALRGAGADVEPALPYLMRAVPSEAPRPVHPLAYASPPLHPPLARALTISATPLATFDQCPRRFFFLHEMHVEEPLDHAQGRAAKERGGPSDDPRAVGSAAHRVLEAWPLSRFGERVETRELVAALARQGLSPEAASTEDTARGIAGFLGSAYAAAIRNGGGRVRREQPFVLNVSCESGSLAVRGTIDLLVELPDGSAEIIDYKRARASDPSAYRFQLALYALAARQTFGLSPVRAGIVFLGSRFDAPAFLSSTDDAALAAFQRRLSDLFAAVREARQSSRFPGIEEPRCRALGCGFRSTCHSR